VDDGSGETEAELLAETVRSLQPEHPCLDDPLLLPENRGKGGAVYAGWDAGLEGDFEWLAFVDADGAVSADEAVRLLRALVGQKEDPPVALFAARVRDGDTEVRRTPLRRLLGDTFRLIVRTIFRLPLRDTQCGLKAVPAGQYRAIRPALHERRFVFDVELAAHLVRSGHPPREFPISWEESPGSRLNLRSAARMLFALFAVRWRMWRS
jgi:glycosyltransferase involved in cell wall biosynthesis